MDGKRIQSEKLKDTVVRQLDELKAHDITVCDVRGRTTIADFFVIATGTSSRHSQALSDKVVASSKHEGCHLIGVEGYETSDWILVDLGDVVVHVMRASARQFYDLEGLWKVHTI